jgi:hypothetical protein
VFFTFFFNELPQEPFLNVLYFLLRVDMEGRRIVRDGVGLVHSEVHDDVLFPVVHEPYIVGYVDQFRKLRAVAIELWEEFAEVAEVALIFTGTAGEVFIEGHLPGHDEEEVEFSHMLQMFSYISKTFPFLEDASVPEEQYNGTGCIFSDE